MIPVEKRERDETLSPEERLAAICPGLTVEIMRSVILSAYAEHVVYVSPFEPPAAAGWTMYSKVTGGIRNALYRLPDWKLFEQENLCLVKNIRTGAAIACTGGDACTGIRECQPSTKSRKGRAAAEVAGQLRMDFSEFFDDSDEGERDSGFWYLLTYIDEAKEEIRFELSLPAVVKKGQHVDKWIDRIIFSPINLSEAPSVASFDDDVADEIEIPITMKKAI